MARINKTITVGANPICVSTGLATSDGVKLTASRVFIQMQPGGSGYGLVMADIGPGRAPDPAVDNDITAYLAPASADGVTPGGNYEDVIATENEEIDLSKMYVHGSNPGDKIKISANLKG